MGKVALTASKEIKYIKCSFKFLTKNKKYNFSNSTICNDQTFKVMLFDRLLELNNLNTLAFSALSKEQGYEKLAKNKSPRKEILKIDETFKSSTFRKDNVNPKKFTIVRLCPNNNPYKARLVGQLLDNILYILFIDINHEIYK